MSIDPQQLLPRRNPGLLARVLDVLRPNADAIVSQPDKPEQSTQTGLVIDSMSTQAGQQMFQLSGRRLDVYADADEMDAASEEVSVALDTIADNVCTSEDGVQVSYVASSKDTAVQTVIDDTNRATDLHTKVKPLTRNAVKYGDAFSEICVDDTLTLVDLKQLPPRTMRRNVDAFGNLMTGTPRYDADGHCTNKPGECAYEQFHPDDPDKLIAAFVPMQIVHTRLNWDGFSAYGRSHLRVTRYSFKKIRALEESMIVGRLTRDYMKLIFYIDTTGLTSPEANKVISDIKRSVTQRGRIDKRGEAPISVMTDFFMNNSYVRVNGQVMENRSKIETIDPKNEGLHNIDDVEHHHRKFLATLRVPPAHIGFERDLNAKATLTQQDVQYVRWLRSIQQTIGQSLEQVYDTALALAAMDPDDAQYRIAWPMLKATDELAAAQAFFARQQGNAILLGKSQQNGIPVIDALYIQDNDLDMTSEDRDELNARLTAQLAAEQAAAQTAADQAHANALEVTKAKAVNPDPNAPENAGAANVPKGDGVPQGRRIRPVTQEARTIYAALMADRALEALEPQLSQISKDQAVTLEEARDLTHEAILSLDKS